MDLLLPPISASLGAMGSLAQKLDALLDTEHKDEMGKLRTRLLELSKARDPPITARIWMKDVRELSYDMENFVDTEADWIYNMSLFMGRVKEANGRYERYRLESVPSHTDVFPIIDHRGRKTDLVVGLHDKGGAVDRLSQLLTDGDEQLKVLSVVGVRGIGKTTLAKQLWREHKHGDYFDCRAFVRTAKKPDMKRILRSILAQVRPHQPPDAGEVHDLIHDLTEHLQDKRYFLIIDDLWATSVWDVATCAFPEANRGSRIITTTEIEDVALACCSYQSKYILKMEPLSEIHSKELFTAAVFGSGERQSGQLDEVSDEIIRRCDGLPHAIISISSVLASYGETNTVENWEQIHNILPTNATSDEILKQVLNFCYSSLPRCIQTCLLYLSMYPENYIILKEDIIKQWVAESFICAPTETEKMEVAGSYFDLLVNMGMIQHIDVDYSNEVLYYTVHHMVHDLITSESIEENFVTVIDYSQRTVRISNKVSRLALQFGGVTYATTPAQIGLSQVRSLVYTGLMSCLPFISEFKLLRLLILHIWADQPSTGVDLSCISELLLLRYLQVTCNDTVHLPEQMQGLKHLEILEINARVAAIPSGIVHIRSLLHLRLGGGSGTELPDVTGILTNVTLNPLTAAILLDESSSPRSSVKTIELFSPICRIPKWIGQLTNLCILKVVVRELLRDDIHVLGGLPALTVLSLYVQQRTTEQIIFATGAFAALEYFEFRCGVLDLAFEEGAMPNLQKMKLGFNAHRGEQYGHLFVGIDHLLNVQEISGIIGSTAGAEEHDLQAAESAFKDATGKHPSNVSIKRSDIVLEEYGPPEKQHSVLGKHPSTSSELPASPKQESQEARKQNTDNNSQLVNRKSNDKEHASVELRNDPRSLMQKVHNDSYTDGSMGYPLLKQSSLDLFKIEPNGLKKFVSFSKWMSDELAADLDIKSSSDAFWSSTETVNVADGSSMSIPINEQLDAYVVSPSLSQDQLFSIIDVSPSWAYTGSQLKVLITGTFLTNKEHVENCKWSCMFGDVEVPVEVLADGSLRCYTPVHQSGRVPFYVTCSNRVACSEAREFEFRDSETQYMEAADPHITGINEMHLHIRLEKLLSLGPDDYEKYVMSDGNEKSELISTIGSLMLDDKFTNLSAPSDEKEFSAAQDKNLEKSVKDKLYYWLIHKIHDDWKGPNVLGMEGQGVIHLVAALGYDWAIRPIITAGVHVNFRDVRGWTALHWAASCGRERTVGALITNGAAAGALTDPTPQFPSGRTPADLASDNGHKGIAGFLAESALTSHLSALTLKEAKGCNVEEICGSSEADGFAEPSSAQLSRQDSQAESLKDSLSAVRKSTLAASKIFQAFRVESFHRKKVVEYGDDDCGLSDERPLSLVSLKNTKSGQNDMPHSAAVRIQNKFRGWKGRKEFMIIRQKIIKIQAHVRGHQVRTNYKKVIWSVGIVEKVILRWRRKGRGLRGFQPDKQLEGPVLTDPTCRRWICRR